MPVIGVPGFSQRSGRDGDVVAHPVLHGCRGLEDTKCCRFILFSLHLRPENPGVEEFQGVTQNKKDAMSN